VSKQKLDILIPTYNRGDLLRDCLRSLLRQTFGNFRIVIWDDGSTDGSTDPENLPDDPRILVLNRGGKNCGIPVARNSLLRLVEAPYFCWQDSDDLSDRKRLETLLAFMYENEEITGVFTPLYFFNGSWSRKHWHLYGVDTSRWGRPTRERPEDYGLDNNCTFATSLYRRVASEVLFDTSKPVGEDYDWIRRLLRAGHTFGSVQEPLYYARRHANRTTEITRRAREKR